MTTNEATVDMGPGTHAIPMSLFRDNRLRVCNALRKIPNIGDENTFVLLQGGDAIPLYNTDVEYIFKQVRLQTISKKSGQFCRDERASELLGFCSLSVTLTIRERCVTLL